MRLRWLSNLNQRESNTVPWAPYCLEPSLSTVSLSTSAPDRKPQKESVLRLHQWGAAACVLVAGRLTIRAPAFSLHTYYITMSLVARAPLHHRHGYYFECTRGVWLCVCVRRRRPLTPWQPPPSTSPSHLSLTHTHTKARTHTHQPLAPRVRAFPCQ